MAPYADFQAQAVGPLRQSMATLPLPKACAIDTLKMQFEGTMQKDFCFFFLMNNFLLPILHYKTVLNTALILHIPAVAQGVVPSAQIARHREGALDKVQLPGGGGYRGAS